MEERKASMTAAFNFLKNSPPRGRKPFTVKKKKINQLRTKESKGEEASLQHRDYKQAA